MRLLDELRAMYHAGVFDVSFLKLLPTIQMITCYGACVVYALSHEWARVVYWGCAGTITLVVTYFMR